MSVQQNLIYLQNQIKKACQSMNRDVQDVLLLAVSKKQPLNKLQEIATVQKHFAENYVQELLERQKLLPYLKWHFIGRLQSNKLKLLVGSVELIHTISHLKHLLLAHKLAQGQDRLQNILLQVNLSGESSKEGFDIYQIKEAFIFLKNSPYLKCKGLMTLPPLTQKAEDSRMYFQQLRGLLKSFKKQFAFLGEDFKELSMGTSQDFIVAIEEGATIVRLGEKLFGARFHSK